MQLHLPVDTVSFSGHESFTMRFSWPKKAHEGLAHDRAFFADPNAMVALGVGKNMVRAIRHWALASGLIEECDDEHSGKGVWLKPTPLGRALLDDDGWDPYLEDVGTIWWLHWCIVTHPTKATTWAWLFTRPRGDRFKKTDLVDELVAIAQAKGSRKPSRASIGRDVDVCLRSYFRPRVSSDNKHFEDSLDSPFTLLGLVGRSVEKDELQLSLADQSSLPTAVFEAALIQFFERRGSHSQAVSLDELMYAPLSPGRVFRLSEEGLMRRLHELTDGGRGYLFHETAGIRQVMMPAGLPDVLTVLSTHYHFDEEVAA